MTQFLPPNLLALFAPRDPIPYFTPVDKPTHEKKRLAYTGLAQFVKNFEDPRDTPAPVRVESKEERKERKRKEKAELQSYKIEQGIAVWNPNGNQAATTDPYKTLFVARISYDTSESKLRREFESYGPIKRIVMVHHKGGGKFRGYAFVEYEHERDMHAAYKRADGRKIDGRRVLVDVERGRTVKGWLPRRFGGGLGNTRVAKEPGTDEPDRRSNERSQRESRERSRKRSRSREHSRTHKRSRSRDKERSDKDRGDRRDRDRDRKDRDRESRGERDNRDSRGERESRGDRDRESRGDRDREKGDRDRGERDKDRSDRKRDRESEGGRGGEREHRESRNHVRNDRDFSGAADSNHHMEDGV